MTEHQFRGLAGQQARVEVVDDYYVRHVGVAMLVDGRHMELKTSSGGSVSITREALAVARPADGRKLRVCAAGDVMERYDAHAAHRALHRRD